MASNLQKYASTRVMRVCYQQTSSNSRLEPNVGERSAQSAIPRNRLTVLPLRTRGERQRNRLPLLRKRKQTDKFFIHWKTHCSNAMVSQCLHSVVRSSSFKSQSHCSRLSLNCGFRQEASLHVVFLDGVVFLDVVE